MRQTKCVAGYAPYTHSPRSEKKKKATPSRCTYQHALEEVEVTSHQLGPADEPAHGCAHGAGQDQVLQLESWSQRLQRRYIDGQSHLLSFQHLGETDAGKQANRQTDRQTDRQREK